MKIGKNYSKGKYEIVPEYGDKKYALMVEKNGEYIIWDQSDTLQGMVAEIEKILAETRSQVRKGG